jgi:thiol-disulfide isomerase/thioredoxin
MKYTLTTVLIFLVLVAVAQTTSPVPSLEDAAFSSWITKRKIPVVTGKLSGMKDGNSRLYSIEYTIVTPFAIKQVHKNASIDAGGNFRLELDYPFPYQEVFLSVEKDFFYTALMVQDGLHIELDMHAIVKDSTEFNGSGVRFSGPDAAFTAYFNDYIKYRRKDQQDISRKISEILYPKDRSVPFNLDSYNLFFAEKRKLTEEYTQLHPSPYALLVQNDLQTGYYSDIISQYWGKVLPDSLWQKIKQHKSFLISNNGASFYSYLSTYTTVMPLIRISANWRDAAALPDLTEQEKHWIDSVRIFESLPSIEKSDPYTSENYANWYNKIKNLVTKALYKKTLSRSIFVLDSIFLPSKSDLLKLQLYNRKDLVDLKTAYDYTLPHITTPWVKQVAGNEYAKVMKEIGNVNAALAKSSGISNPKISFGKAILKTGFGAQLYQAENIRAEDFLAKLRAAYPDKALYIDRWATWCAPCIGEMPYSKKLQLATKGLPVEYIYLCTANGSDADKWKTKVAELKQPGIHIYIDEKLDTDLSRMLNFGGYPSYGFIDIKGKYQKAERPSALDRDKISMLLK